MQNINALIQKYEFEDGILIKEIVRRCSSHDLVDRINECFQKEGDLEKQGGLIELVQDILCCRNRWVTRRYSNKFRRALDGSSFPSILNQKMVTNDNRINCHLTSFFKYSDRTYLPILQRIYKHALIHDPIEISLIVGEINWVSTEFNWDIIKNLSHSQDFLHRWSVLDVFSSIAVNDDEQFEKKKLGILRLLCQDSNPFIAQEASWLIFESRFDHAYVKGRPKSKLARKNYRKKMRPFGNAVSDVKLKCTFWEIQVKYYRLRPFFPATVPVHDIIEGILMFGWQHPVLDKDYDKWLAAKITNYIEEKTKGAGNVT